MCNVYGTTTKGFPFHVDQERFIPAYVINVIEEAKLLKNLQRVWCAAEPECVEFLLLNHQPTSSAFFHERAPKGKRAVRQEVWHRVR